MKLREWYRVENQADDSASADVYIYDEIGKSYWNDAAISAKQFIDALNAMPDGVKTIRLHINSPGGNVFEALAIANAIKAQRDSKGRSVDVMIDGIAASAATIVSSAGSTIRIADNAMMMIHDPVSLEWGPAVVLRKAADTLDAIKDSIVATYQWVSSKATDELKAMMTAETWMSAQQALEHGFVTEIVTGKAVTACFRPEVTARLGQIPAAFADRVQALIASPEKAKADAGPVALEPLRVLALCREAGCLDEAEGLVQAKATEDQVKARVAAVKSDRAKAADRRNQIVALCGTAHRADLAQSYIDGGMSVDGVKAQLAIVTALVDKAEIDAALTPAQEGRKARPAINAANVYAQMNQRTA